LIVVLQYLLQPWRGLWLRKQIGMEEGMNEELGEQLLQLIVEA